MNPVVEAILSHKYKDKSMRRQVFIYKRSKNTRIQNKVFNKLFVAYTDENPVSIIGDIVLMQGELYFDMKNKIDDLKQQIEHKYK